MPTYGFATAKKNRQMLAVFFGAGWETGLHGWQSPSGGAGNPSLLLRGLRG